MFIPTLTFGAIIGAVCAESLCLLDIIGEEYFALIIIVGMSAFLGASSRTPITACVFAMEALCTPSNVLPVAVGVTISFLVIELLGIEGFNETVIEARVEASRKGKNAQVLDVHLTVKAGAFAVGKEIRDILWPPTCVVLSVVKNAQAKTSVGLSEGDVLHVHYRTYDPHTTFAELEALVGVQETDVRIKGYTAGENQTVPEL